ncbi:MAG TPA: hypothetical protein VFG50_13365 [Rhodothermales bacterium]|nr:hypothetical protein [Rhodothermales bacterium]
MYEPTRGSGGENERRRGGEKERRNMGVWGFIPNPDDQYQWEKLPILEQMQTTPVSPSFDRLRTGSWKGGELLLLLLLVK